LRGESESANACRKIWSVADLLRGDFKQSEFGKIILPFTVLRRLECVLEPTRQAVHNSYESLKNEKGLDFELILPSIAGVGFYSTSQFTLSSLGATNTRQNLEDYISKFSSNVRQVFEQFSFASWIAKLSDSNLLYLIAQQFKDIDLHPRSTTNHDMGLVFEHLIRKFAESANDTAGEFYTPRDVVQLATTLVLSTDEEALTEEGVVRTVYDCAAGTGGFLSAAIEIVSSWSAGARLVPYAQELNPETHAICVADKLIQNYDTKNIKLGNTLSNDQLSGEQFNYCLANPPFGVDWKKVQAEVVNEHRIKGMNGRFGPGLPRVNDGSMLFLMHLLSKRKPPDDKDGTRIGIVLSGSPLFNGGAGSGESEIRRWILENDWLEAIIGLPGDMFYNTGIGTYIWILTTRKEKMRKGLVQLIDATDICTPMRKSLGSKRKFFTDDQVAQIARIHDAFEETTNSKIFKNTEFGYRRITVERPLQLRFNVTPEKLAAYQETKTPEFIDQFESISGQGSFCSLEAFLEAAKIKKLGKVARKSVLSIFGESAPEADLVLDEAGKPLPDPNLRDYENVPLSEPIEDYFEREVLPHVPGAWIDASKKIAEMVKLVL